MNSVPDSPSLSPDPIAAFEAAQAALNQEDWAAVAALCDPASLVLFRRSMVDQFAPAEPPRLLTVDEYQRNDPTMPREVAEYHVAQHNRYWGEREKRLAAEFVGVPSIDVLLALSPAQLFARWLEGHSTRHQVRQMAARGQVDAATAATYANAPTPQARYRAIGAVVDVGDFAYVVYRHDVDRDGITHPGAARWLATLTEDERELVHRRPLGVQIAVCRRQPDGSWRFLAEHGFLGVGRTVITRVEVRPGGDPSSLEHES